MTATPVLEVQGLKKYFPVKGGILRHVTGHLKAVDDVSLKIEASRTFGLVGESGCGKSTLGLTILRLHEPSAGSIRLNGQDIGKLGKRELADRRKEMQIIFQDPYASLSPRRTVGQTLLEPLDRHRIGSPVQRRQRVQELLEIVGLRPQILNRFPHEFSGGQRQRIGIARALALHPSFIVADEAVSALDVSVQSQVLNLLHDLQQDLGIALLVISHDLAVVQHVSDIVGVMYLGKLVEVAAAQELYDQPRHPYTQALMSAAPVARPGGRDKRIILAGDVPSPMDPPSGCSFHTRCPQAMPQCKTQLPVQSNQGTENNPHLVTCHLYDE